MNIDIAGQDYFEELKLMETQYGQEEDLYPWIYMILQMAECRKRDLLGPQYEGISIRDVHNADKERIKELAGSKVVRATPDFIVMGKSKEKCFGCVEIKNFFNGKGQKLINFLEVVDKNKVTIEEIDVPNIEYRLWCRNEGKEWFYLSVDQSVYDKIEELKRTEDGCRNDFNYTIEQNGKIIITNYCKNKHTALELNVSKKLNSKEPQLCIKEDDPTKTVNKSKNKNYKCLAVLKDSPAAKLLKLEQKEQAEMISHIKSFKKVLYTNGLQFCLFTLSSEGEKAKVIKLANLKAAYTKYNESDENAAIADKRMILTETNKEWNKLINALVNIDWHADPTTQIPQND